MVVNGRITQAIRNHTPATRSVITNTSVIEDQITRRVAQLPIIHTRIMETLHICFRKG